jgi:hypothetical protein
LTERQRRLVAAQLGTHASSELELTRAAHASSRLELARM